MRVQHLHRHVTLFVPVFVACIAAACNGADRRAAADGARGLATDSFVAPARAVSSNAATFADSARHGVAASRRDTSPQVAGVVIAGSPSGLTLSGDAVQPSVGATSGQVASGQEAVNGGTAPPVPPAQQPETPTIIVNDPAAPAATPTPTPASPSTTTPPPTPPKATPSATPPRVVARPGPDAPTYPTPRVPRGGVRHPQPGTSDTASTRPCGSAGTSDTASRSPCGQPGTSDTATAPRRAPALFPGSRSRPVIPLTPQGVSSNRPPQPIRESVTARAPTRTTIARRTSPPATRKP